jgi:hypothetical protein
MTHAQPLTFTSWIIPGVLNVVTMKTTHALVLCALLGALAVAVAEVSPCCASV